MLTCRWLRALPILVLAWLTLAASNARAQTISVPALSNVGSGLQGAANTATLSTSQHGGKTVHVESDNPSVVLVAPNTTTAGAASFDVSRPQREHQRIIRHSGHGGHDRDRDGHGVGARIY